MKIFLIGVFITICSITYTQGYVLTDSTLDERYSTNYRHLTKANLINNSPTDYTKNVDIKADSHKPAKVLRIVALPFFAAALIANNSRGLSNGFLIAGASIELTSIFLELHKKKKKNISLSHE